jgi:hypothetical protein
VVASLAVIESAKVVADDLALAALAFEVLVAALIGRLAVNSERLVFGAGANGLSR